MPKEKNWVPVIRRRGETLLLNSFLLTTYQDQYYQEVLQVPRGVHDAKYINGWVIFEADDVGELEDAFAGRMSADYLDFLISKCQKESDRLTATAEEIRSEKPYSDMSNSELASIFSVYSGAVMRVMPFLAGIVILEGVLQDKLKAMLEKHIEEEGLEVDLESSLSKLVFPREKTGPSKALIGLYKLASEVNSDEGLEKAFTSTDSTLEILKKEHSEFKQKFDSYLEKYDFMDMEYYSGNPMSSEELVKRIDQVQDKAQEKLSQIKKDNKRAEEEFEKTCDNLDLTERIREFVNLARNIHKQRQYRADALFRAGRDVFGFMKEIGSRFGLEDYESVVALDWREMMESLLQDSLVISREEVASRKKDWGFVLEKGEYSYLTGEDLQEEKEKLAGGKRKKEQLKGNPAFSGVYEGIVKIVTLPKEIEKVNEGDVLVSPMTDPYYVPAMTEAGAIITDEGGVLSHAAIVSRELGVPCVIGTQKATQVLNDGDKVKVDAEEGIVKILEKNE